MVISLERGADLHMAQLMPLLLTVSCFSKIQIGFAFLVPAHLDSSGKRAVKRVCVCVCMHMAHNSSNGCENSQFVPLLCVDSSIPADVEEVRGDSREDKRKGPRPKKLTDKDYEEMPTENLDWEKISAEEKERMKDWARRKEKELLEQASELQFRLVSFALHWYTLVYCLWYF